MPVYGFLPGRDRARACVHACMRACVCKLCPRASLVNERMRTCVCVVRAHMRTCVCSRAGAPVCARFTRARATAGGVGTCARAYGVLASVACARACVGACDCALRNYARKPLAAHEAAPHVCKCAQGARVNACALFAAGRRAWVPRYRQTGAPTQARAPLIAPPQTVTTQRAWGTRSNAICHTPRRGVPFCVQRALDALQHHGQRHWRPPPHRVRVRGRNNRGASVDPTLAREVPGRICMNTLRAHAHSTPGHAHPPEHHTPEADGNDENPAHAGIAILSQPCAPQAPRCSWNNFGRVAP